MRRKPLTVSETIEVVRGLDWTTTPTLDIQRSLMDKYEVSHNTAVKAIDKLLIADVIYQVWESRTVSMKHRGSNAMCLTGGLNIQEGYCKWQINEDNLRKFTE